MKKRTDRLRAAYIDLAINVAAVSGPAAGARALRDMNVGIDLALRVLLRPGARRGGSSGNPPAPPASAITARTSQDAGEGTTPNSDFQGRPA